MSALPSNEALLAELDRVVRETLAYFDGPGRMTRPAAAPRPHGGCRAGQRGAPASGGPARPRRRGPPPRAARRAAARWAPRPPRSSPPGSLCPGAGSRLSARLLLLVDAIVLG